MGMLQHPDPAPVHGLDLLPCLAPAGACPLTWPFDNARVLYASGVRAGLIRRSLLAGGAFERSLGVLERMTLGPWARAV